MKRFSCKFCETFQNTFFGALSASCTYMIVIYVVQNDTKNTNNIYCVKSVRIQSYSGLDFPTFGLNTERYRVSLRLQSECGKMRTRITPNTDTFHAVIVIVSIIMIMNREIKMILHQSIFHFLRNMLRR